MMFSDVKFDPDCRQCRRLDGFLCTVKRKYPGYHARPVAPFGDAAGILLYQALYDFGFSNWPVSEALTDGLVLTDCRITNAVKCLPPQNKPTSEEISRCNSYLAAELNTLPEKSVILALGFIAHQAVLKACGLQLSKVKFAHNAYHALPDGRILLDSYHSSRYNVQTRRLSKEMFYDVFGTVRQLVECS